MKRKLLTLLMSGLAITGFAHVAPLTGASDLWLGNESQLLWCGANAATSQSLWYGGDISNVYQANDGWGIVASNKLSGTSSSEIDGTNVQGSYFFGVFQSSASGAIFDGEQYCYAIKNPYKNDHLLVKQDIAEAGTYKFSFRTRLEDTRSTTNVTLNLCYGTDANSRTAVSEDFTLTVSSALPGDLRESNEIELQPGTYYFGLQYVDATGQSNNTFAFIGDFNLYKKGAAPAVETYAVTWTEPVNGTLSVMNGDEPLTNGAEVEAGTQLVITATPSDGYQLETLTVNGESFTSGDTYTVESATTIAVTFAAAGPGEWPHDETGINPYDKEPSVHPSEQRYVTSATTSGATVDLNYTNNVCPTEFYINTGVTMQAAQGSSFDLRMQGSDDIIWCHAVIFADWNNDKDFDDEGEFIAKVGYDSSDADVPSNFSRVGNDPLLKDFTQAIKVPENAAVGVTCLRVMYTDAWHNKDQGHTHSAMDAVSKGGIYDFYIDITEAAPVVETYAVSWTEPENGTVSVMNGQEPVTNGAEVEVGTELVITATPSQGYMLSSLTVNDEPFTSGETYTVEGETTIAATFGQECHLGWTEENGTITVMNGEEVVENGGVVAAGTELVATFTPNENYELGTVTLNSEDVTDQVVDGALTFTATGAATILSAVFVEAVVPEPSNLTAIQMEGASSSYTHYMFYFEEDDYGQGADGDFYNGRDGNITMSAWVNIHQAQGRLFGYGQKWYNPEGVFEVSFQDGKFKMRHRTANETHTGCMETQIVVTDYSPVLDEWAFVTAVYDTDNLKFYLYYNGVQVYENSFDYYGLGLLPDDCVFYVSNGTEADWSGFNSPSLDLDEVQVWDRALSADEVLASMTNVDPAAEGLISLYRFGADMMSEDYTFSNLSANGSATAALYYGSQYGNPGSISSSIIQPTFVEGHVTPTVENYVVTWEAPANGTLTVTSGETELESGAEVASGTQLTISATPDFGYQLGTLTVNSETFANNSTYTVTGETVIAATFDKMQFEPWPHDMTGIAGSNPSVHPKEQRYVTSATTEGALVELNYTNDVCPSDYYINTNALMQAQQGTSFELRMQASEDIIWCHAMIYVDWNGDHVFDDETEFVAKVGLDSTDPGAGSTFYLTGNPELDDFTQVIEVPYTAKVGVTCMRVMYTDAWHTNAHSAMAAVDKGGIYDFYIDITQTDENVLIMEGDHATIRVRDYDTYADYENGAILEDGARLLISATPDEGYELESVTVNGEEWPAYETYTVDGPVHVVATTTELPTYTLTYSLEGEEFGSIRVFNSSDNSDIENNGTLVAGQTIAVSVNMEDNVQGTIVIKHGETTTEEEFDSATWEGQYTTRIKDISGDVDIQVVLTEKEVSSTYYDLTYTIEGADFGEIYFYDTNTFAEYASGDSIPEGTSITLSIAYNPDEATLAVRINGEEQDIAASSMFEGMYYSAFTMNQDTNVEIVLTSTTVPEPTNYTVTYTLEGEEYGTLYVNKWVSPYEHIESGEEVAEGTPVNVQVSFTDPNVSGELYINDEFIEGFDYESANGGVYNYTIDSLSEDVDIRVVLTNVNGIAGSLADGLKVYPTMFDESVTVEVPVDARVTIFNVSGAAVRTMQVFAGFNSLQLSDLESGLYLMRVESEGEAEIVEIVKK